MFSHPKDSLTFKRLIALKKDFLEIIYGRSVTVFFLKFLLKIEWVHFCQTPMLKFIHNASLYNNQVHRDLHFIIFFCVRWLSFLLNTLSCVGRVSLQIHCDAMRQTASSSRLERTFKHQLMNKNIRFPHPGAPLEFHCELRKIRSTVVCQIKSTKPRLWYEMRSLWQGVFYL